MVKVRVTMFFIHILLIFSALQNVFGATVAERAKAYSQKVIDSQKSAEKPLVSSNVPVTNVIRESVKVAEDQTISTFVKLYTAAMANPTHKLRIMVYALRCKTAQDKLFAKTNFTAGVTTGIKAPLSTFDSSLVEDNLKMIAAYAPYNNTMSVTKDDVKAFAEKYPNSVKGIDLKTLEGDVLPPLADGKKVAYNPFSYGMVVVYRLRNVDKLNGEKPLDIDLYDKDKAFSWEKAAGYSGTK